MFFIDIYIAYILRLFFHGMNLVRSRRWPIAQATVLRADCPGTINGCTVATVYYEYVVAGVKYGDSFDKPFIVHEWGESHAAQIVKGMLFRVRVKPGDAETSVPLWKVPSMT